MTSNRPYLLRALYEWILDNGMTPHLLVDTTVQGTVVPQNYIENNRIILNLGPDAVREIVLGNDLITFSARFGEKSCHLTVPVNSVIAIYAKENGKGLVFETEDTQADEQTQDRTDEMSNKPAKPHLKVIK
jgi:stringent starvation protein B